MDGQRFDDAVSAGARQGTRRGFLGGLAGVVAGLTGLAGAPRAASAQQTCPSDQLFRRGIGCVCKRSLRPPVNGRCTSCESGLRACLDGTCASCCQDTFTVFGADPQALNTGIAFAAGDTATVTASGTTEWCGGCTVGPEGENSQATGCFFNTGFGCGALVGAVTAGRRPVYANPERYTAIGAGPTVLTASGGGTLLLQIVDACDICYADNAGSLSVVVDYCAG